MSGQSIDILYDIDTKGKHLERSAWTINRNAAKKNLLEQLFFFFFWDLRENGCSFPRLTGDCFQPFYSESFLFLFFFLPKVKKTICKTSFLILLAAGQTMEDIHYQSCWVSWIPNSRLELLWNHSSSKWQIHFPKSIKQLSRRFNCPNLSSLDFVNPRHQSQLRSQRDLELLHTAVLEMTSTSCLQVSHGCKDPQVLRGKVLVRLAPSFFFSCHYCYTLWLFGVFLFWFTAFFFSFFFQSWLYYHKSCNLNTAVSQENLTSLNNEKKFFFFCNIGAANDKGSARPPTTKMTTNFN